MSKISNVVNNDAVKKTGYNKLVMKLKNIETTGFVLKTKYDTDKLDLEKKISDAEKKIPDTKSLVKKADINAKITEIESKIPSISGLVTNTALAAVENKTPEVSNIVKKTDVNTKLVKLKIKLVIMIMIINTSEFNKLTIENFKARLAQTNLVTKTDVDAKLTSLNKKSTQIKQNNCLLKMN